jgi:hypothetical protein
MNSPMVYRTHTCTHKYKQTNTQTLHVRLGNDEWSQTSEPCKYKSGVWPTQQGSADSSTHTRARGKPGVQIQESVSSQQHTHSMYSALYSAH